MPRGSQVETCHLGIDAQRDAICIDDRCERLDVHARHVIHEDAVLVRRRIEQLGWVNHPLEPVLNAERADRLVAPQFLDDIVLQHVSRVIPKSVRMIWTDVVDDYGSLEERRLYRSLRRLKLSERIVHVNLARIANGATMGAYLLPGSPMIRDPWLILEQLIDYQEHKGPGGAS